MAWRRDEIWLDTDLLWFLDRTGALGAALELRAPSFFGAGAAAAVAIPNGLATSRWRRAELRRRRQDRRTRTAALVIVPAAMLSLAGGRLDGGFKAAGALQADPPSLTFRPGAATAPTQGETAPLFERKGEQGTDSTTARLPKIHWRRATSHGLPYSGRLTAGTQLPIEGPDWVTWNPIEDSVPNEPRRLYGNEHTIRATLSVIAAYRAASPGAPRVVVGDISFRSGGPMEAHRSHQNGLDVDVYYPRLDGALRAPRTTRQIDRRLAQRLLDGFVAAGVQMVFVGYSTGLHGPKDVVVPYPNHENHMHVRFPPRRH
jgi:penicillin-insensitive murein endopeptidase